MCYTNKKKYLREALVLFSPRVSSKNLLLLLLVYHGLGSLLHDPRDHRDGALRRPLRHDNTRIHGQLGGLHHPPPHVLSSLAADGIVEGLGDLGRLGLHVVQLVVEPGPRKGGAVCQLPLRRPLEKNKKERERERNSPAHKKLKPARRVAGAEFAGPGRGGRVLRRREKRGGGEGKERGVLDEDSRRQRGWREEERTVRDSPARRHGSAAGRPMTASLVEARVSKLYPGSPPQGRFSPSRGPPPRRLSSLAT